MDFGRVPKLTVPSDLRRIINEHFNNLWQDEWELLDRNKLHKVLPVVQENVVPKGMSRRESTVYVRLRIGHSHLTNCYLLRNEPQPFCIPCNENITIEHLLTNCADYSHIRTKYYNANLIKDVLQLDNIKNVMAFLKEAQFYNKI